MAGQYCKHLKIVKTFDIVLWKRTKVIQSIQKLKKYSAQTHGSDHRQGLIKFLCTLYKKHKTHSP